MGSKDLKAKIRLEGDAKGANKAIKSTETRFQKLGKTIKTSALAQVAAIGGVVLALRSMVRGIGASIEAANKQEDAINALDGALADLGPTADGISKALQEQAAALQLVTRFGDEETIQAQALLASFVKEEDAIKAATVATMDLAEAKGFSLVSAADLVSKTLGSSTNALTRYGIEVTGAVGSTERLTTLTENIAKVFGGRATKAAETFSGKMTQLSNAFGDMQEAIGQSITENDKMGDSIDDLKDTIVDVTPEVAALAEHIVGISVESLNALARLAQLTTALVTLGDTTGAFVDKAEFAEAALRAQAARAEILAEITSLLASVTGQSAEEFEKQGNAMLKALGFMESYSDATGDAAAELKALEEAAKESATAMEKLGDSLDQVTSAELSAEILEIETNLEAVRVTTGGIGPEFERLERIAAAKIASLRGQVETLEDGLGDTGKALDGVGDSASDAGDQFDSLGTSVQGTTDALKRQETQARGTTRALEGLTAAQESLTLAQQRTALAATQAARKRITGVSSQFSGIEDYALSLFGTGGRVTTDPSGNLVPV